MDKFPKMYESWACMVNTPESDVETQLYNLVNYIDNFKAYTEQKLESIEDKYQNILLENVSLKNNIDLLEQRIELLENKGTVSTLSISQGDLLQSKIQSKINIEVN